MDPTSAALRALATQSSWTPVLAFAAGAASSLSPCVAPRMLAVSALTVNKTISCTLWVVGIFTAGVVAAYSMLALGGTLVWHVVSFSGYLYMGIAAVTGVAGVLALTRHSECERAPSLHSNESLSSVFLLGASSAVTFSPCCLSVVAAAALYAHSTGPLFAWIMAACFALGHTVPLTFAALGSRAIGLVVQSGVQAAARVVAGALMLAVAGFYFVLA